MDTDSDGCRRETRLKGTKILFLGTNDPLADLTDLVDLVVVEVKDSIAWISSHQSWPA